MAPRKIHRLGMMEARLSRAGITMQIGNAPPMLLSLSEAKALAATLAAALCEARLGTR